MSQDSAEQRDELERWLHLSATSQLLALWARIVLKNAEASSRRAVATALGTPQATVRKWCRR